MHSEILRRKKNTARELLENIEEVDLEEIGDGTLREEFDPAVKTLKDGKIPAVDSIQAYFMQLAEEETKDAL